MRTALKRSRAAGYLAILLLIIVPFFSPTPAGAISGGTSVPASQLPYVAFIQVHTGPGSTSWCTGTLIGPRWVLTAAHCVLDSNGNRYPLSDFKVSVGHEAADWNKTFISVNRVERHPNYPAHLGGVNIWPADFALIQLSQAVSNTPLPLAATEPPVGTTVTFAGWGCTTVGAAQCHKTSTRLNVGTSIVQPDSACGFPSLGQAYVAFDICTSRSGNLSTIRPGDSGGPMIKKTPLGDRLAGVISGSGANVDGSGSVAYVLGWIHQITGIGAPAESNPTPPPGQAVYNYQVYHTCANGACGLRFHTGPGYSNYPVTRTLLDGTTVGIVCQTVGQSVSGVDGSSSNVWDKTAQGDYASDFYINTPGMTGAFSPPIPRC